MRIGSTYSGSGALDLAVERVFDAEPVWFCEFDEAPSKVLKHHWPAVPNYGDITAVDWASVPPIEIYSGGFPCQDVSAAGKRAGLKRGTRTGLWHHTAHAIDVLRPRWTVLENVLGLLSADGDEWPDSVKGLSALAAKWGRVVALILRKITKAERRGTLTPEWQARKDAELVRARREEQRAKAVFTKERLRLVPRAIATVLAALAAMGYDVRWFVCKASDVGAPHHRTRVFILASREPWAVPVGARPVARLDDESWTEPDHGLFGSIPFSGPWPHAGCIVDGVAYEVEVDVAARAVDVLPTPAASNPNDGEDPATWEARRAMLAERRGGARGDEMLLPGVAVAAATGELLPTPNAADGSGGRMNSDGHQKTLPGTAIEQSVEWGKYAPAIRRWESATRQSPAPTEPNRNGRPRLAAAFAEWMMGWPGGWVTDPAIGITRPEQLKIIGNGVVDLQAEHAIRTVMSWPAAGEVAA